MRTIIKLCTEMEVKNTRLAEKAAKKENIRNVAIPTAFGLALQKGKLWKNGSTITIKFMNGSTKVKQKIQDTAGEWQKYANLKFKFVTSGTAQIRIGVKWKGDSGSWSYIGTDAKQIPSNEPTMNFGWLSDNSDQDEYNRVVIHEFGHALGCIHEHQNPKANIPWDKDAVYAYYKRTNGWDKATVDNNIFEKYSESKTNSSAFDKKSIMLYSIPEQLTIGDFSVGSNRVLSETDKSFIGVCYPFTEKPPMNELIHNVVYNADIGKAGEDDLYNLNVATGSTFTIQTGGTTDTVLEVIDEKLNVIAWNDDFGGKLNSSVTLKLAKGSYTVRIRHYSNKGTGKYTLLAQKDGSSIYRISPTDSSNNYIKFKNVSNSSIQQGSGNYMAVIG